MQLVSGWARNWARLNTDPIYSHSEFGLPVKETVLFFFKHMVNQTQSQEV